MANTRSALKRVRQTKTRQARNQSMKSRIKTAKTAAQAALDSGDQKAIDAAVSTLFSVADKALKSGLIHKNLSSRIKERYAAKINAKAKA